MRANTRQARGLPIAITLGLVALSCNASRTPAPTLAPASVTQLPTSVSLLTLTSPAATPPPPPTSYEDLYASLSDALSEFEDHLAANWDGARGETVFGAELIIANGNRGDVLLQPATMAGVRLYLDRLQQIGVGGVTVQIADPLLSPGYARSDEYLAFYRQVAEEARGRGLVLTVETGPVFPDPQFSRVQYDWSQLTLDEYFQIRHDDLVRIATEIGPDYLSLGNEPATEAMLTGLSFSLQDYLAFVRETAADVDRSQGTRIGAGTGTWEDPSYLEALTAEPSLDFIGLHLYPLSNGRTDYWLRAIEAAQAAAANGRAVVVGEAWLYKASPEEVAAGMAYQDVFGRDLYSFWQPLDSRFLTAVVGMADWLDFDYVSFFWSGLFFGYLDYDALLSGLPAPELYARLNQEEFAGLQAGRLTETGRAYQALLAGR